MDLQLDLARERLVENDRDRGVLVFEVTAGVDGDDDLRRVPGLQRILRQRSASCNRNWTSPT